MHLPAKEKVYASAAAAILFGGVSYFGVQKLRPDAPLSVETISRDTPPVDALKPAEETKPALKEVVVHLAGAVKKGGLYHLPPDSRIDDAIKAAGGAKTDADLEAINLAARAVDGDQIYVPHKKAAEPAKVEEAQRVPSNYRGGEIKSSYSVRPLTVMPPPLGGSPSRSSAPKAVASGPVSLNTGSHSQLETLPGVGPATAQKILDYRQEHGGFGTIEEIQMVKGIGPKKFEKLKPFLKL